MIYSSSIVKLFMAPFKGVSTKHLNNYLIWHNFVNYAPESEIDKRSILLRFVTTQNITIHTEDIAAKPMLPFAAKKLPTEIGSLRILSS